MQISYSQVLLNLLHEVMIKKCMKDKREEEYGCICVPVY